MLFVQTHKSFKFCFNFGSMHLNNIFVFRQQCYKMKEFLCVPLKNLKGFTSWDSGQKEVIYGSDYALDRKGSWICCLTLYVTKGRYPSQLKLFRLVLKRFQIIKYLRYFSTDCLLGILHDLLSGEGIRI